MKSETICKLEAALARLGRNRLLELKLRHLPKNFTFFERESDEMVLGRSLMEKYDDSPDEGQAGKYSGWFSRISQIQRAKGRLGGENDDGNH